MDTECSLFSRVDLHIPGEDIVGGYSIVSPPHQLKETQSIELAIKHNNHPPTLWMTTKVSVVWIKVLQSPSLSSVCILLLREGRGEGAG